jgi:hypothetical protein
VRPYNTSGSGTYRIAFNTSTTAPIPTAIPLTVNVWANGNIPTAGGVQWFTFTANASTQYIHIAIGTLAALYVQVYDSSGATVGSETYFSSDTSTSRTLTSGNTYYIRVRPYSSTGGNGTYRIGFTTSTTAPTS